MQESIRKDKGSIKQSPLARKLLLKGENKREFEKMMANILSDILPKTEIEKILCEKIISTAWKMKRAMVVERNLLNKENEISMEERRGDEWGVSPRQRIRNINKVRMQSPEVLKVIQYQINLDKTLQKTLERIRTVRNSKINNDNE